MNYTVKNNEVCPISKTRNFTDYLDLGDMPLVNNLNNTKEESIKAQKYPLRVQYCEDSGLSMLSHSVNPEILYSYYYYKSSISQPYVNHCLKMYEYLNDRYDLSGNKCVLDIGGNDGTLLEQFLLKNPKLRVVNVDPSINLSDISAKKNIPTVNKFWGSQVAKQINEKFDVIVSTNVFQHTENINDFVEAISISLSDKGVWCLEFPYWQHSIETNQFDQVYHEHIYYYNVKPLEMLFKSYGLSIINTEFLDIHGGSLRLVISKSNASAIVTPLDKEYHDIDQYLTWGKSIQNRIEKSREFICDLKSKGYRIAGFGAAAKGCIFLNTAKIDHTILDYVIDDTDIKQGKFIPGTGIEVVNRDTLKNNPVDYIVILAHNFSDYIVRSLQNQKGKMIVFFPEKRII